MASSSGGGSSSSSVVVHERKLFQGLRMENPFTFKVGQVFTGFGVGCGVGIGVGRPINLGAVPMLGQVMSATRGATDALSGVSRHVNDSLRKIGAKNIEAGIGCGVGFGHGFGVGLAIKPGILQKIQSSLFEAMTKTMSKLGISPNIPHGALPVSMQSGIGMMSDSTQNSMGNSSQLATKLPDHTSLGLPGYESFGSGPLGSTYESFSSSSSVDTAFGSRTEKVLGSFLQNPVFKEGDTELNQLAGRLQSENNMLQMVLKHQQAIEELMDENEKLRRILVEDLKISPSKLQSSSHSSRKTYSCTDCFECRRKQRKIR